MNGSNFDKDFLLINTKADLHCYITELNKFIQHNNVEAKNMFKDAPKMFILKGGYMNRCAYLKMKVINVLEKLTIQENVYRVVVEINTFIDDEFKRIRTNIVCVLSESDLSNINNGKIEYLYGIVNTGNNKYSKSLFYIKEFGLFTKDIFSQDNSPSDFYTGFGGFIFNDETINFDDYYQAYNFKNRFIYCKNLEESSEDSVKKDKKLNQCVTNNIEEFSKTDYDIELLNEAINDIDLIREINQARIHPLNKRRILEFKEDGESKIYLNCNGKIIKTPYFLIKQSIEEGFLKFLDKSIIKIFNNRLNEISVMYGGPKKAVILRRFNLEPKKINYEREPDDNRNTVTAFAPIDYNTHQFKTEDIFYSDLSKSCYKNPHYIKKGSK